MKIAVTGTGGGVGQSILKSLQNTDYELIALDGEYLAPGLFTTTKSYLIPYASDSHYVESLLKICNEEKISLLFPGLDAELSVLSKNEYLFKKKGIQVIISSPEVIEISDDKWATYTKLSQMGINVPKTILGKDFKIEDFAFPFIVKQRIGGARSKNIFLVRNEYDWQKVQDKIQDRWHNYIVMEYIEGDEYTCGTISIENDCKGVIVMRRILRDGDTHKCFVEKNEIIENEVTKLINAIKPFGACNIQLRLRDGIPYIFEVNARCSGTTAARSLSGFNEPKMIADYLLKGINPTFLIKEQTILRYWQELVVDDENVKMLQKNNFLEQINPPNL